MLRIESIKNSQDMIINLSKKKIWRLKSTLSNHISTLGFISYFCNFCQLSDFCSKSKLINFKNAVKITVKKYKNEIIWFFN
jgi:hypothetical protein